MAMNPTDLVEYQNDHDLLIELRTEMRGMRHDLKLMNDTTVTTVSDHETRIRSVETQVITMDATSREREKLTRLGGVVFVVIIGIIEFVVNRIWP